MQKNLGVVLIQMIVTDKKEENIATMTRLIRTAVQRHSPRLVCLPECFIVPHGRRDLFERFAERFTDGEAFRALSNLAKELKIYIVGGSIPERDDQLYNTIPVFSPNGDLICKHRQMHAVEMDVQNDFRMHKGEFIKLDKRITMFELDNIKIGLGVCCDFFYPELATLYRKNGCHMMIYASAFPKKCHELCCDILTRTRAFDNQMLVCHISQARNEKILEDVCCGHSLICDGFGRVLQRCNDKEEILHHELDFAELQRCRDQIKLFNCKRTDVYDTVYKC